MREGSAGLPGGRDGARRRWRNAITVSEGSLPPDGPRRGLVAACLRGDRDAWEELDRSHAGLVYTVLRRSGLGDDEATEAFQQVWVATWQGLAGVQDERELGGWLVTIAARMAARAHHRRSRGPLVVGEAYETATARTPDPAPEQAALEREQGEARRRAIASLSERDRLLVHAFFYDPTAPSYAEIAARLGISPETVGPMRTRCLRRLRAVLDDRLDRTGTGT